MIHLISLSCQFYVTLLKFEDCIPTSDTEGVHSRFCWRILRVRISTQNDSIYCELGKMALYNGRLINIVRYWLHFRSWRFPPAPNTERVHLHLCLPILKVKISIENYFIYCELGKIPLYNARLINIVKRIIHGMKCQNVKVYCQLGVKLFWLD